MPGTAIQLGPFSGGMNTFSDKSSLADNELVDAVNFEVDIDGSLVSRPPAVKHTSVSPSGRMNILGYAMFTTGTYLIGSCSGGVYSFDGSAWTLITNTIHPVCMVQYQSKIWIPAHPTDAAGTGGSWNGTTWTVSSQMPRGSSIIVHKGRAFIVGGVSDTSVNRSTLYWSAVTDPSSWSTSNDFIDINKGDGQAAVEVKVFQDNIFIFKQESCYALIYDTDPKNDTALLRKISGTIGATKERCVVLYENNMYVFFEGWVYECVNYDFTRINTKVPFVYIPYTGTGTMVDDVYLNIFGDRLICRYYTRVYVFGLRTRTWTRWYSAYRIGPLVEFPAQYIRATPAPYYAGGVINTNTDIYQLNDGYDYVNKEEMECTITTKNYDFDLTYRFKRLFYWGADVYSIDGVTAYLTPVVYGFRVTWGQLKPYLWQDLYTWLYPLTNPQSEVDTVSVGPITNRVFLKFMKAVRFRQVNFGLKMTTDGSLSRGPVRIFSLTAMIRAKEHVVRAVS